VTLLAKEIKTWEIINGELREINGSLIDADRKEKEHLEEWIKTNPKILGEDIFIIGEQVYTKSGALDFLGIDNSGNIVIVELKRDKLPREVLAQTIDYASDVATWDMHKLSEICLGYSGQSLEDYVSENFEGVQLEDLVINKTQRLLLVGFSIEEPLSRMIEWLSSNYDVSVNALILKYIRTSNGSELLSKTAIISEEVEKAKANKRSFKISMSDEPGNYSTDELKELVKSYFSKKIYSAVRIKNILLPYLLMHDKKVNRGEIKNEFVRLNASENLTQAGQFLSLISNQLGQKDKDFLRQIISYEYPNNSWEKDNFYLIEEYKDMVDNILQELRDVNNVDIYFSHKE
jgi:hypothetical protein